MNMNEWMIQWAFTAPFVTVGAQPCGWVMVLALVSYGLAFLAVTVRKPWEWATLTCGGLLLVLSVSGILPVVMGPPNPAQLARALDFAAAGFLFVALLAFFTPIRRRSALLWDFILGMAYSLGFVSCGPYFATLSASASVGGWSGLLQLVAYALGLIALTGILMFLIILAHRWLLRRLSMNLKHIRFIGLLGLVAAGLALWL